MTNDTSSAVRARRHHPFATAGCHLTTPQPLSFAIDEITHRADAEKARVRSIQPKTSQK
jgi:hypothetical protein